MRLVPKEPLKDSTNTWLWFLAISLVLTLILSAALAQAGTVTVAYREPADRDLVRCRLTLQNAAGAAVDTKEIVAFNNDQAHEGIVLNFDERALQGQTGRVVGWCVDQSGQTSVDSASVNAIFRDLVPGAPEFIGVQVLP